MRVRVRVGARGVRVGYLRGMAFEPPPPRSALTLRVVLAAFGVVLFVAAAVLAVVYELPAGWVIVFGAFAVVALVDLVVVAWRKRSENG
ncbi:hypothetical protein EV651_105120 [Kribbella sp. VKM Ac-2571]|nr:hypothetical protein EV651_105120 [Kribbella sp. VKM Ac-2571]